MKLLTEMFKEERKVTHALQNHPENIVKRETRDSGAQNEIFQP